VLSVIVIAVDGCPPPPGRGTRCGRIGSVCAGHASLNRDSDRPLVRSLGLVTGGADDGLGAHEGKEERLLAVVDESMADRAVFYGCWRWFVYGLVIGQNDEL
jgi:hypothetical protein